MIEEFPYPVGTIRYYLASAGLPVTDELVKDIIDTAIATQANPEQLIHSLSGLLFPRSPIMDIPVLGVKHEAEQERLSTREENLQETPEETSS